MRKTTVYLLIIFAGILIAKYKFDSLPKTPAYHPAHALPRDVNFLRVVKGAPAQPHIRIPTHPPLELDGLSREKIYEIRKQYVEEYRDLVQGEYSPAPSVFGAIQSGKPWWGLRGQFCYGNGERSIEGLSEESRIIANPFHLLYLLEGQAFRLKSGCYPVYPRPSRLSWSRVKHQAVAKYDLGSFFREKRALNLSSWSTSFTFDRMNAIDFGYNYIYIDPDLSSGVKGTKDSLILKEPCLLRGFIHVGGSCGYPGGCNNGSPYQKELYFRITDLPARIFCRLWKKKPADPKQDADFEFIFELD